MNTFWITLLEINLILSTVYLGYLLLLKNLTFFKWTRVYLLGGMLLALVYPLLKVKKVVQTESVTVILPNFTAVANEQNFDYNQWVIYAFSIIFAVLFLRFLLRFLSLGKIHQNSNMDEFNGYSFRNTNAKVNPFSFWKWIYIHRPAHSENQLNQIVTHEYIHTSQRHTFDVIVAEISSMICWYNPIIRLLNKAVKDNLEYLVDSQVIDSGIDKTSYQHSLVGISLTGLPNGHLGNHFAFKTLKRRIIMMNKKQSSKLRLFSFIVLTPLILGVASLLTFSCQKSDDVTHKGVLKKKPKVEFGKPVLGSDPPFGSTTKTTTFYVQPAESKTTLAPSKNEEKQIAIDGRKTAENFYNEPILNTTLPKTSKFSPLFFLDGKEILNLENINPDDIESITVYKDKFATEKYGERGENGVISIISKASSQ